jgi:hypothetical protein
MVAALDCDFDQLSEYHDDKEAHDPTEHNGETWDVAFATDAAHLAELDEARTIDGEKFDDADTVRERIQESPLSVQVRGGWYAPGEDKPEAEEFEILLSTGGPALRIMGELSQGEPSRAWLEYQDWGTGWTQYFKVEQDTLLTFCQQFYFGE